MSSEMITSPFGFYEPKSASEFESTRFLTANIAEMIRGLLRKKAVLVSPCTSPLVGIVRTRAVDVTGPIPCLENGKQIIVDARICLNVSEINFVIEQAKFEQEEALLFRWKVAVEAVRKCYCFLNLTPHRMFGYEMSRPMEMVRDMDGYVVSQMAGRCIQPLIQRKLPLNRGVLDTLITQDAMRWSNTAHKKTVDDILGQTPIEKFYNTLASN